MKNRLPIFLALLCWGLASARAQSPYHIYFGDIHSQTWYSDGNKEQDTNTYRKPVAQAMTYARDVAHNMNFLGVSDHNHRGSSDLHMNPGYWRAGNAEADSMNQDGVFVSMYGQEWGVINNGGHVLIYGTNKLFGWEANNYDVYVSEYNYSMLFDSVKKYGGFCYFAHPQATDYSGIFSNPFNPAWDSVVVGTAMKNGPALTAGYTESDPASGDYTSRFHDLLRLGYHVAPCANQDNHYTNFGNLNQQRTAVLATSLTRANIIEALRHRRTYATEDHNLQLRFEVGAHQMGEIFTINGSIPFRVKAVEPDGDGFSTIELRYGVPGSGAAPTALTSVAGQDSLVLSQPQTEGTTYYYYAYVKETNGREAWSAPMWITAGPNSAPAPFSQLSPGNAAGNQDTSGTLTWQPASGADVYDVYLGTDTTFAVPVSANQTGISYSYSGLGGGTGYYWKVVAKNGVGQATASGAPWSFMTHSNAPVPPSSVVVDAVTLTSIQFHWTDEAADETGYRVYRAFSPGGPFSQLGGDLPANTVSFTDTGLSTDRRCYYRVAAFNGQGEGAYAQIAKSTLASAPGQPALSDPGFVSVNLSIDPGANPSNTQFAIGGGIDSVQFYVQSDGSTGASPAWQTLAGWGGSGGVRVRGLHQCVLYQFTATARNGDSVPTAPGPQATQALPCFSVGRTVGGGWNIVSLPLGVTDASLAASFPASLSRAFSYQGGYVRHDTLRQYAGYWIKFDTSNVFTFAGDPEAGDSIPVAGGWNLVGTISFPVDAAAIQSQPTGLLSSPFFGYSGVYVIADSLRPIEGYWVKSKGPGKLVLTSSGAKASPAVPAHARPESPYRFTFQDRAGHRQVLTIAETESGEGPGLSQEAPPLPPPDAFDVRFQSQRYKESLRSGDGNAQRFPILLQSGDGAIRFSWQIAPDRSRDFGMVVGAKHIPLGTQGSLELAIGTNRIIIEARNPASRGVPVAFALRQNYPNPFNPSTSIEYDLPVDSRVRLTVYDPIGILVGTLVDEIQAAGYHAASWRPERPSGVYFYRIEAVGKENSSVSFRDVKRMILMR